MSELKHNQCGVPPLSFFQMLAACVVRDTATGRTALNVDWDLSGLACGCEQVMECNTSHLDPERFVVQHVFELDPCGLMRLKLVTCE
jgi:hypothetical protein